MQGMDYDTKASEDVQVLKYISVNHENCSHILYSMKSLSAAGKFKKKRYLEENQKRKVGLSSVFPYNARPSSGCSGQFS